MISFFTVGEHEGERRREGERKREREGETERERERGRERVVAHAKHMLISIISNYTLMSLTLFYLFILG